MTDRKLPDLLQKPYGLLETLGIEFIRLEPQEVVATMPVTTRHHQPLGYLHGGASVALAESVASVGGVLLCEPGKVTFGMEINANHLRPKQDGSLRAVGRPVFAGRTTQVWQVDIYDEEERLICTSRCTLAVIADPESGR